MIFWSLLILHSLLVWVYFQLGIAPISNRLDLEQCYNSPGGQILLTGLKAESNYTNGYNSDNSSGCSNNNDSSNDSCCGGNNRNSTGRGSAVILVEVI